MREIKFRAWDKLGHEMLYSGNVKDEDDNTHTRMSAFFSICVETFEGKITKMIELMQFTGLKDKNGKDIYEGDIVRIDEEIYSIYWHEGHAGYWIKRHPKDFDGTWNMYYVSANGEVIGNVYENPELIK